VWFCFARRQKRKGEARLLPLGFIYSGLYAVLCFRFFVAADIALCMPMAMKRTAHAAIENPTT
jgi:hypothetical protein